MPIITDLMKKSHILSVYFSGANCTLWTNSNYGAEGWVSIKDIPEGFLIYNDNLDDKNSYRESNYQWK